MDLESRLRQHLTSTGEELVAPPASPEEPIARAASRRRRRRALGSSLAAVALVAGGLGLARMADRGSSQDIVAGGDDQEANTAASEGPEDSGPASSEPPSDEEPATPIGDSNGELPESTGPVLEWSERNADTSIYPAGIVWSGTSFLATAGDERGSRLVSTTDGSSWTEVGGLPDDVDLWGLQSDGAGMIVTWGQDRFAELAATRGPIPSRLFTSTDDGASWDEILVPDHGAAGTGSDYLMAFSNIGGAAVSGDVLVVGITQHLELDIDRLLADRGIESAEFFGYGTGDGQLMVCGDPDCRTEETYSYEDLGLTEEEISSLEHGLGSTVIHRSVAGGPLEETALTASGGFADAILAANGEFIVCMMGGEDGTQTLHASADGQSWEVRSSGNTQTGALTSDGTSLFAQAWDGAGNSLVRSDDGGRTWSPVGMDHPGIHWLGGGPGGLVATGQLFDDTYYDESMSEQEFPVSIEKDGYVVTWSPETMTVVEAASGETIYEFGPEEMDADEPPAGIVETADGFDILDPDSGEILVSIGEADFEAAFGIEQMVPDVEPTDFEEPEFFVGWSADGRTWGWQTASDAFGINGWAQLAVGQDQVLAIVEQFPAPGEEEIHEYRPQVRVFVAEIN